jgi:hypothetical protein
VRLTTQEATLKQALVAQDNPQLLQAQLSIWLAEAVGAHSLVVVQEMAD